MTFPHPNSSTHSLLPSTHCQWISNLLECKAGGTCHDISVSHDIMRSHMTSIICRTLKQHADSCQRNLLLVAQKRIELSARSSRALKTILDDHGIKTAGLMEKRDLVECILGHNIRVPSVATAAPSPPADSNPEVGQSAYVLSFNMFWSVPAGNCPACIENHVHLVWITSLLSVCEPMLAQTVFGWLCRLSTCRVCSCLSHMLATLIQGFLNMQMSACRAHLVKVQKCL